MVFVNKGHNGPRSKLLVCAHAKGGKDCLYVPWEYPFFEKSLLTYCQGLDIENFLQLDGSFSLGKNCCLILSCSIVFREFTKQTKRQCSS